MNSPSMFRDQQSSSVQPSKTGSNTTLLVFAGFGLLLLILLIAYRVQHAVPVAMPVQPEPTEQAESGQVIPARWSREGPSVDGGVLLAPGVDVVTQDGPDVLVAVPGGGQVWVARLDLPVWMHLPEPTAIPEQTAVPVAEPVYQPVYEPVYEPVYVAPTAVPQICATVNAGDLSVTRCAADRWTAQELADAAMDEMILSGRGE